MIVNNNNNKDKITELCIRCLILKLLTKLL